MMLASPALQRDWLRREREGLGLRAVPEILVRDHVCTHEAPERLGALFPPLDAIWTRWWRVVGDRRKLDPVYPSAQTHLPKPN